MVISFFYLLAGIFAFFGALVTYRYRHLPGSYPFLIICLLMGIAAYASNMEYGSTTLASKLLWRNVQQIGYLYSPVMTFLLAMAYSMYASYVTRKITLVLNLVPTLGLALIYTNPYHLLMRKSAAIDDHGMLVVEKTGLNNLILLYGFGVFVLGIFVLVRTMFFTRGIQSRQLLMLLIGFILPPVISTLRIFQLFPIKGYGSSIAMTFIPSYVFLLWGMYKYQLFKVVPIARNKLFDVMKEGIVVLDGDSRILDINQAANNMLGGMGREPGDRLNGKILDKAVPMIEVWMQAHRSGEERNIELVFVDRNNRRQYVSVKVIPVKYGTRTFVGSMSVLTDITEMKQKEQELRRIAMTDGLTDIYNRTGFIDISERYLSDAIAEEQPLSLLVMDLDDFKNINDRYGHQTGDNAIVAFVEAVKPLIGEHSVFGRMGGEEFALTLLRVSEHQAYELAESIRRAVEQASVFSPDGIEIRFTVSIGLVSRIGKDQSLERLYSIADQSLYRAKQNGRNQTCVTLRAL